MIEYIHGDLTELTPTQAVIETAGVGYALSISLNTYTAIPVSYTHLTLPTNREV